MVSYILEDRITASNVEITIDDGAFVLTPTADAESAEFIIYDPVLAVYNKCFISDGQFAFETTAVAQDDIIVLDDVTTSTPYRLYIVDGQFYFAPFYTQTLSENLTPADLDVDILKYLGITLTEDVVCTDFRVAAVFKNLVELSLQSDAITKYTIKKAFVESVLNTDDLGIYKFINLVLTEIAISSDDAKRAIYKALLEAVSETDTIPGASPVVPNYDYLETVQLTDAVTTVLREAWRMIATPTTTWTNVTTSTGVWARVDETV